MLANTYAALTELNYFSSGQMFTARYEGAEGGNKPFTEAGPPFQRCFLLDLPERASSTEDSAEVLAQAGQFLYRDLGTALGPALDQARRPFQQAYHMIGRAHYQSFGLYRVVWPRRRLLHHSARNLCKSLVERWMSKDARAVSDEVRMWSLEQWEALGMRPEAVIESHQSKCEKNLGEVPTRMFEGIISPVGTALSKGKTAASAELNMAPVVQALDNLERLLGLPEECRPPGAHPSEPGPVEKALQQAAEAVAGEAEQKLLEVVVRLIEEPAYRLAGAEEALRHFCVTVEQALQAQEPLAKDLHDRSVLIHQRLQVFLDAPPVLQETRTTSLWKFGRRSATEKSSPAEELLDLLKAFAKCRYQSLVLMHVNRLYLSLRGHLSDQIREVGFCRQRLGELAGLFAAPADDAAARARRRVSESEDFLLPAGCTKVEEAITILDKRIGPDELLAFDQRIQVIVEKEYRALVHVCMGTSHVVKNLAPLMMRDAEIFLQPLLQGASVADLFLKQNAGPGKDVREALLAAYDEAAPELGKPAAGTEVCIVAVPNDEPGMELKKILGEALPGAHVVALDRSDEIVFYREQLQLTAADLEQLGPHAQEAYRQRESARSRYPPLPGRYQRMAKHPSTVRGAGAAPVSSFSAAPTACTSPPHAVGSRLNRFNNDQHLRRNLDPRACRCRAHRRIRAPNAGADLRHA